MANLYHRKLLSDFDATDILHELDRSITYLKGLGMELGDPLKDTLIGRLELRKAFLSAVTMDETIDRQKASLWERCSQLLPKIKQTTSHGVPVDHSFSAKIQRRLASSVPPRPIVSIKLDDAYAFLSRLCMNGKEAYRILDYHGGVNLMVCRDLSSSNDVENRANAHRHSCGHSNPVRHSPLCTYVPFCSL